MAKHQSLYGSFIPCRGILRARATNATELWPKLPWEGQKPSQAPVRIAWSSCCFCTHTQMLNLYFQTSISRMDSHLKNTVFAGFTKVMSPSVEWPVGKFQLKHVHQRERKLGYSHSYSAKFSSQLHYQGHIHIVASVIIQLCLFPHVLLNCHFSYISELLVFQKMPFIASQLHLTNLSTSLNSQDEKLCWHHRMMPKENFVPNL